MQRRHIVFRDVCFLKRQWFRTFQTTCSSVIFVWQPRPYKGDFAVLMTSDLHVYGSARSDVQFCGRVAKCGRQTKRLWTTISHRTQSCVDMHTSLFDYGLSIGPAEGLSSTSRSPTSTPPPPSPMANKNESQWWLKIAITSSQIIQKFSWK